MTHEAVLLLLICLNHVDLREIHRELRDSGELTLQKLVQRVRLLFQVFDQFSKALGYLDLSDLGPDFFFPHLLFTQLGILRAVHPVKVTLIRHHSDHLAYLVKFLRQTVALGAEHAELVLEELHLPRLHKYLRAEHQVTAVRPEALLQVLEGLDLPLDGLKVLEEDLIAVVHIRVKIS